jgi:hypothetical protein
MTDKSSNSRRSQSVGNLVPNGFGYWWIIAIGVVMLLCAGSVFAQFTVQPMKIELPVRPGKYVKSAIELRNLDPNEVHTVDLSIVELSQWENGTWRIIEPNDPNFDTSTLSSCSEWISFRPETVSIGPYGMAPVELSVRVPPAVRGFYAAGILVSIRPRPGASDVSVILQFLIPVTLEIQGRMPRHQVQIGDVGLEAVEQRGENPATTLVSVSVENNGGTYSRLKPMARIWGLSSGRWRLVTTTELKEVSIIPGAKLKLRGDMQRALPSGKYKVSGALYVDGRRAKNLEKTIDFTGKTPVGTVVTDAPLDIIPTEALMDSMPGATRSAVIKVYNASEEAVNVQAALGLPRSLQGVSFGDVKGDDLSCIQWTKVTPENFTLRGYGQQSVRITSTMPSPGAVYPCYYAFLGLWSTYPDGQKAGVTTANICVSNREIKVEPEIQPMKLVPSAMDESKYLVVARFGNFGWVHFKPVKCRAVATTGMGTPVVSTLLTGHKVGVMLPLEVRDFSGALDFSPVSPGTYRLTAVMEYATGEVVQRVNKQIAVRVSIEGERRIVEVVQTEEELQEKVEVQW